MLNYPILRVALSYRSMCAMYKERLKLATTFDKNVFRLFRLPLLRILSKMQMPDPPFFLLPPLLNKQRRKDLTPEERQLVLDYDLQNLQKGPDEGDEIDGCVVLLHGTVKFLVGQFKVDKTTIQSIWNHAFESYYNGDTYVFASISRKFCAGRLLKYNRVNK